MNIEKKLLKEIAKKQVLRKVEIKDFLKDKDGKKTNKLIKKLMDKGFIVSVPFIESCFAITQRGMRELEK